MVRRRQSEGRAAEIGQAKTADAGWIRATFFIITCKSNSIFLLRCASAFCLCIGGAFDILIPHISSEDVHFGVVSCQGRD